MQFMITIEKAVKYFKATSGKRSMNVIEQKNSGLDPEEFIEIYDNYDEWCLIIASLIVVHKRLDESKIKNMIKNLFEEER